MSLSAVSPDPATRRVLATLGRGILRRDYEPEIPERMLETLGRTASAVDRRRILAALKLLDSRAGALALASRRAPVSWLAPAEAEALVSSWKSSRLRFRRDLGSVAVSLATSALYSRPGPQWERIGYPGPLGEPPDEPKELPLYPVERGEVISCDAVVVGSGAAGGCVAAHLAERGLDVVVLEKGGYHAERDFTHIEPEAFRDMYLYGAVLTTTDLGVRILAGSTLGGGTVINWTTSFRTPAPVLREWARVSGVDAFVSGEIEDSLDETSERLGVNSYSSAASKRDELMEEGLKKLGLHVDVIPRNVRGCLQDERCGYCPYGCRSGAKQSALRTYLQDAAGEGARLVVGADVRRVTIEDGRATGVEAVCEGKRLTVQARAVVAAAGSIETPALLLRSGLTRQVGHNLRLHPGTAVAGIFDEDVRMWEGTMQARYSALPDGAWDGGYAATLETGPLHPGSWATAIPWISAAQHRDMMGKYVNTSVIAVLSRDTARGRVTIDKHGVPRVEYSVTPADESRIADAVVTAGAVLEAAGANEIHSLHRVPLSYRTGAESARERWEAATRAAGYRNGAVTFASFHQMGSCRMGTDPGNSVVGADNEAHEVRALFVVDGSTFPTASGVNPMLSIFGIANRAAKKIAARLG